MALGQAPALAATINVDTTTPDIDGADGQCSLIEAIDNANDTATGSVHGDCTAGDPAGADTLQLKANSTHTLTSINSYLGYNGLPVVSSAITIAGNGSTITRGSGAFAFRIFRVNVSGNLTLQETTVSGGVSRTHGGGILSGGVLTLTNSTVSGNSARYGGGVVNDGTLTLTHSTVSGNSAGSRGGGVYNRQTPLTLAHSTVTGNSAGVEGGGVSNYGRLGLPPYTDFPITLTHSLLSGNTAPSGAEVANRLAFNFHGTVTADNFNLFGHSGASGATGPADAGLTDIVPRESLTEILSLTLANNGGPTQTHALVAGSPAIDAVTDGSCPPPADDQRGVSRPQPAGGNCDIGSFEIMPPPPPDLAVSKTDSPDPVVVTDHLTYTITVNNAGTGDATGVTLTDTLDSSVDFVSATPSQGSCGGLVGLEVNCDLGDLASGANAATVTLVVQPTAIGRSRTTWR